MQSQFMLRLGMQKAVAHGTDFQTVPEPINNFSQGNVSLCWKSSTWLAPCPTQWYLQRLWEMSCL